MPKLVAQTRVFIEVISIWMYSGMRSFSDKRSESSWKDMPTELTETHYSSSDSLPRNSIEIGNGSCGRASVKSTFSARGEMKE